MRKQQIENAAYEVATQVRAVEDSIEAAIGAIADLQSKMVRARSVTGVAFVASHSAFEQLASATLGLVSARGGIANCHSALVEAKAFVPGLRTVGIGDEECPPPEGFLRVVA
jgi:dGTP triphosphohydrolase